MRYPELLVKQVGRGVVGNGYANLRFKAWDLSAVAALHCFSVDPARSLVWQTHTSIWN